jgi:penicillin-binding protein 2
MESEADRNRTFSRRALLLGAGQVGVGFVLTGRMAYLSVFQASDYALQAEDNRVSLRLMPPRRGLILDRFGVPLALNRQDYRLAIIPEQIGDLEATLASVQKLVPLTAADLDRIRKQIKIVPRYLPVEVAKNVDWAKFAALNVQLPELTGVQPIQGYTRSYPDGPAVAHLLGYVGAPTKEQADENGTPLFRLPGFKVGKQGLEKAVDERLRGVAGASRVEVDAYGKVVRDLDKVSDQPGKSLVLTIDRELQVYASQRLANEAASAILMSVDTGEVLAYASMPGFDPNSFSDGISRDLWASLQADEKNPLMNKPVGGQFPPGSTFKMITAMAALESGLVQPEDRAFCSGRYMLGKHAFHCHKRRGHGSVNLTSGIYLSCDTYFYTIGRQIGADRIAAMARKFGLGETYDLPIPWQKAGLVPTPAWKQKRYSQDWLVGETLNYSIGQGYLLTTPLQLAVMAARIASGRQVVPRLYRSDSEPTVAPLLDVNHDHLGLVRQAMADVVNARGGTAGGARLGMGELTMAGKTGTAQVRRISMDERRRGVRTNNSLPWKQRDHALFVAFAPVAAPRYAIAVVVEHGGSGSKAAAPVARDIMKLALQRDPLAQRALLAGKTNVPSAGQTDG